MDETMLARMDESELAKALGASVFHPSSRNYRAVCTDSRTVSSDDLFVALAGERYDAHDFLPDVIRAGCRGAVVSRMIEVPGDFTLFVVEDMLKSFGLLAKIILERRRSMGGFTTYAVTGSNGKTTSKELLATLLTAQGHRVLKTEGNLNNFIGLPMTVLKLSPSHDVAVLEMGANAPGEIAYLSELGRPDIAMITCVGEAHLEGFGSIEGVARAKGEMLDAPGLKKIVLPSETGKYYKNRIPEGVEVIWVGNESSHEAVCICDVQVRPDGIEFDYCNHNVKKHLILHLLGGHNAFNLAMCMAALDSDTMSGDEINRALKTVRLPSGRMERWVSPEGVSFIHDAYNANPMSMRGAIRMMAGFGSTCLILGDMRELGNSSAELHRGVGRAAAAVHPLKILCVGEFSGDLRSGAMEAGYPQSDIFCTSLEELNPGLEWLSRSLTKDSVCLVKGSRGVRLERVLEYFNAARQPI